MGWLDKATAAARIAVTETRKAAIEGAALVEAEYSGDARFESMKEGFRTLSAKSKEVAAEARSLGSEVAQELGQTEMGTVIGENARTLGAFVTTLPVLTALGDTVKSRNGVDELYAQYLEDPQSPRRAVLLAEALLRSEGDMKLYERVRSVTSLTYALRRQMITSTLHFGNEARDPTRLRLLKIAYSRSVALVRSNPGDAEALHTLARVYSGMNRHEEAVTAAKLSVLADPRDGLPWVTLGRGYLGLGQADNAERAAFQAVELGAGYGNEIAAAALLMREERPRLNTVSQFEELRSRITAQDRIDYLGFATDVWAIAESLNSKQMGKLQTQTARLKAL